VSAPLGGQDTCRRWTARHSFSDFAAEHLHARTDSLTEGCTGRGDLLVKYDRNMGQFALLHRAYCQHWCDTF